MDRFGIKRLRLLLGSLAILTFCGCQVSDIFVTGNENASGSADGTRPAPDDAGDGTGNGEEGTGSVPQFSIQVSVMPEGAGTISLEPPGGRYDEGTEVTLIAEPSEGFTFAGYSGDVTSEESETTIIVDRDMLVTAEFFPKSVSVTVNLEPPDAGIVTLTPPGGTYEWGATITLVAEAKPGFSFDAYVDEQGAIASAEPTYSLIADGDVVLTALFVAVEPELFNLTVDVDPDGAGTVSLDPPGGMYELGTTVSLTATPNPGFVFEAFVNGEGSLLRTQAVYTVRVTENALFIAKFASSTTPPPVTTVTLSIEVTPTASGTVALDPPGGSYSAGTVVALTATPAAGYVFVAYSGDASGIDPMTTIAMNSEKRVRAEFQWVPRVGNPGNLLVTGFAGSNVTEFDRFDGALLGGIVADGSGDLDLAGGIDFGPNGNIFVASFGSNNVLRYDSATGAFLGEFAAAPGFFSVLTLRFGPNGNLYVPDTASDSVLEFDGNNGELMGTFVAARSGGLDNPVGLAFGLSGNLFVVSQRTNSVIEYNGTTGALIGTFADLGGSGFTVPVDLAFNVAGDAFITTSGNDSVARVNRETRVVTTFVVSGLGGLDSPAGITVHPDTGNILVANQSTDQVLEYNGSSGEFVGVFANGAAGDNLFFMTFRPR